MRVRLRRKVTAVLISLPYVTHSGRIRRNGMSVDDPRFATAYRPEDGTDKIFDDLGGMIIYGRETGELDSSLAWVHDFETEEWIVADEAFYVATGEVATPMGHGILAFSTRERAETFATDAGSEVISWDVVVELPVDDGLLGHQSIQRREVLGARLLTACKFQSRLSVVDLIIHIDTCPRQYHIRFLNVRFELGQSLTLPNEVATVHIHLCQNTRYRAAHLDHHVRFDQANHLRRQAIIDLRVADRGADNE